MSQKNRYDDVSQMVRGCSESSEFADSFENLLSQRQLIKQLLVMRATKGISQEDMAKEMKCSQSRISKLENSVHGDLSLTDLHTYLSALGYAMEVQIGLRRLNQFVGKRITVHERKAKRRRS